MVTNLYKKLEGCEDREEYLSMLADEYELDISVVKNLAEILGQEEDFDGLVVALQDCNDEGICRG